MQQVALDTPNVRDRIALYAHVHITWGVGWSGCCDIFFLDCELDDHETVRDFHELIFEWEIFLRMIRLPLECE